MIIATYTPVRAALKIGVEPGWAILDYRVRDMSEEYRSALSQLSVQSVVPGKTPSSPSCSIWSLGADHPAYGAHAILVLSEDCPTLNHAVEGFLATTRANKECERRRIEKAEQDKKTLETIARLEEQIEHLRKTL